ncbi:MAG: HlyD family secretion protein [Geminicoccaceae bacterium]
MRHGLRLVILGLLVLAAFAWLFGYRFVAYTGDAYVRSDMVGIAPDVEGAVVGLHVIDNQHVATGDLLVTIDPSRYQLAVDLQQKVLAAAEAEIADRQDALKTAQAAVDRAQARLLLAQETSDRTRDLHAKGDLPQAAVDTATSALTSGKADVDAANAQLAAAAAAVADQAAIVETERARLALAQHDLDRTIVRSPVTGYVNQLSLRVGDYARTGVPLLGVVDDTAWRIIANYKEYVAAGMVPGTKVKVWLDAYPWRWFDGTVKGVSRGIARSPEPEALLPYVEPTTDWIRLPRRFPVTITLDALPEDIRLHMGADARVLWLP